MFSADGDDLTDDVVHDGHLGYVIGGIVWTEDYKTEGVDLDAIVLLEHIAIEVLLQTVMIIRGVGQVKASDIGLASKGFDDGLAIDIDHLLAAFPVVDGKGAVGIAADHIDGTCHVHIKIVDGPLLTIGTDLIVANETEELLLLVLYVDLFRLPFIAKRTDGLEGAITEPVLSLFVYECAHLAGHTAYSLPLLKRLFHRDAITLPLANGLFLGIEGLKEIGHQRTHWQQLVATIVEIDMSLWLEIDMSVLLIKAGIGKCRHLCFYISHFDCKGNQKSEK